jgi:two-component system sensor histidine kinase YesM
MAAKSRKPAWLAKIHRIYLNSSLRNKMLLLFSVLIMLMLFAVGFISFQQYSRTSSQRTREYSMQIIDQVIRNINYFVQEMESISSFANYNGSIQSFLKSTSTFGDDDLETTIQNVKTLDNIVSLRSDIVSVLILGKNGRIIGNNQTAAINPQYDFARQLWYREALANPGQSVIVRSHKQNYFLDSSKIVISLCRAITNYDDTDPMGVMLIDLNLKALEDICRDVQLGEDGYIFIVDPQGNMIFHPDYSYMYRSVDDMYIRNIFKPDDILIPEVLSQPSGSFIKEVNRENMQVTFKQIPATGWVIVAVTPYSEIIADIVNIRDTILLIGAICLLMTFFFSLLISSAITRPIRRLEKRMEAAEQGHLDVVAENYPTDEVGLLSMKLDSMLTKIKGLMHDVVIEQEAKRKSEMKALQAQINPHFLYNTLDSIVWMAETNNSEVVVMTEALARLFRITLSRGEDQITLEQELEHVRNYLIIQSLRYTNKFDYQIDAEESLLPVKVLKLILQPLVENAIYHGIKNQRQKGHIHISAQTMDGRLLILVQDDGIGMSPDKAATLLSAPSEGKNRPSGIGVRNVHDRIQLYYGPEYGLHFESAPNQGTTVKIWLPLQNDPPANGAEGDGHDQ